MDIEKFSQVARQSHELEPSMAELLLEHACETAREIAQRLRNGTILIEDGMTKAQTSTQPRRRSARGPGMTAAPAQSLAVSQTNTEALVVTGVDLEDEVGAANAEAIDLFFSYTLIDYSVHSDNELGLAHIPLYNFMHQAAGALSREQRQSVLLYPRKDGEGQSPGGVNHFTLQQWYLEWGMLQSLPLEGEVILGEIIASDIGKLAIDAGMKPQQGSV